MNESSCIVIFVHRAIKFGGLSHFGTIPVIVLALVRWGLHPAVVGLNQILKTLVSHVNPDGLREVDLRIDLLGTEGLSRLEISILDLETLDEGFPVAKGRVEVIYRQFRNVDFHLVEAVIIGVLCLHFDFCDVHI